LQNRAKHGLDEVMLNDGKAFTLFGAASVATLPRTLQTWHQQRQVP
jgi:hypothetical protein